MIAKFSKSKKPDQQPNIPQIADTIKGKMKPVSNTKTGNMGLTRTGDYKGHK